MQAGRDVRIIHKQNAYPWPRAGSAVLIVGTAVAGGLALLYGGPLAPAVRAWGVPLAVMACVAVALLRSRGKRVFLVTSAFRQKYWVAGLLQHLHGVLDRNGLDLVFKTPEHDYDAAAQAHNLRRLVRSRREYVGGIVLATEVPRMQSELVEFCSEVRVPVVFTDIEPFDEARYPSNAAFVGYLSTDLGALAGHWLADHFTQHRVRRPRVLIVASLEHSDRQRCCVEVLRARVNGISIVLEDSCAFQRSRAYDVVRTHVRGLDVRHGRLDAVFCTNDEMALGAVDALHAIDSPATRNTVIIGVDGVPEVRALIDSSTSPLRATVVQDSNRLAESAMHMMTRMRRGRVASKRTILRPEVHQAPSEIAMNSRKRNKLATRTGIMQTEKPPGVQIGPQLEHRCNETTD